MNMGVLLLDPKFKVALQRNCLAPLDWYQNVKSKGRWRNGYMNTSDLREPKDKATNSYLCKTNFNGVKVICYVGTYYTEYATKANYEKNLFNSKHTNHPNIRRWRTFKYCGKHTNHHFYLCQLSGDNEFQYLTLEEINKCREDKEFLKICNSVKDEDPKEFHELRNKIYTFWYNNFHFKYYLTKEEKSEIRKAETRKRREEEKRIKEAKLAEYRKGHKPHTPWGTASGPTIILK